MSPAQKEESIQFAIDLEFLLPGTLVWRNILPNVLFKKGELSEPAEKAKETIRED